MLRGKVLKTRARKHIRIVNALLLSGASVMFGIGTVYPLNLEAQSLPGGERAGERARLKEPGLIGLPPLTELINESAKVHRESQQSDAIERTGEIRTRASYLRPRLEARCEIELSKEADPGSPTEEQIRDSCSEATERLNDTLNSLPPIPGHGHD